MSLIFSNVLQAADKITFRDIECKTMSASDSLNVVQVRPGYLVVLECAKNNKNFDCISSDSASDLKDKVKLTFLKPVNGLTAYSNESSNAVYYVDKEAKRYRSVEVYESLTVKSLLVISKSCVGTFESK